VPILYVHVNGDPVAIPTRRDAQLNNPTYPALESRQTLRYN